MERLIQVGLAVLLSWSVVFAGNDGIAGPVSEVSFKDGAEPTQKANENKFWTNTLNTYNMFRQVAAAFVADVNAIVNVADAVQKQIDAIERLFLDVEDIAAQYDALQKTIKDGKWKDAKNAVELVEIIEEEVLQKADGLMVSAAYNLPNDVVAAWEAKNGIKNSKNEFGTLLKKQGRALDSAAYSVSWIRNNAWFSGMVTGVYQYDLKTLGEKKNEIQKAFMADGKTDPVKMAEGNKNVRREELMRTLMEHDVLANNINFWAEILKMKTEALAATNTQRYNLFLDLGGNFEE